MKRKKGTHPRILKYKNSGVRPFFSFPPFLLLFLSGEFYAVGQELFVAVEIDIVLGADVLFQPRSFTQHHCRMQCPGFRENVRVLHRYFVIDSVFIDAKETAK